jgi:hypothetical protein
MARAFACWPPSYGVTPKRGSALHSIGQGLQGWVTAFFSCLGVPDAPNFEVTR